MKKIFAFTIAISIVFVSILGVFADKLSEIKNEKQKLDNKINQLIADKKRAQDNLKNTKNDKKEILASQEDRNKELETLISERDKYTRLIKSNDEALDEAEDQYKQRIELLKERIRIMYENSEVSAFDLFVQSKDLSDFIDNYEIMKSIYAQDKDLLSQLNTDMIDIAFKKKQKEKEREEIQRAANNTVTTINKLTATKDALDEKIKTIDSKLRKIEMEEDDLQKKSEELINTIRKLQSTKEKYSGGSMTWPTPSTTSIGSYFGMRLHPILRTYRMHTGIDINAGMGVSIVAVNSGTVIVSGWQGGYGNAIVIDHGGGISSLYGHCSKLLVSQGQKVSAGDVIAKVGSTGLSTGPHLHFEIRKSGNPVDPLSYFNK